MTLATKRTLKSLPWFFWINDYILYICQILPNWYVGFSGHCNKKQVLLWLCDVEKCAIPESRVCLYKISKCNANRRMIMYEQMCVSAPLLWFWQKALHSVPSFITTCLAVWYKTAFRTSAKVELQSRQKSSVSQTQARCYPVKWH